MHMCISRHVQTRTHTHMLLCSWSRANTLAHTHTHTHVAVLITRKHAHTANTHTHTHMLLCSWSRASWACFWKPLTPVQSTKECWASLQVCVCGMIRRCCAQLWHAQKDLCSGHSPMHKCSHQGNVEHLFRCVCHDQQLLCAIIVGCGSRRRICALGTVDVCVQSSRESWASL